MEKGDTSLFRLTTLYFSIGLLMDLNTTEATCDKNIRTLKHSLTDLLQEVKFVSPVLLVTENVTNNVDLESLLSLQGLKCEIHSLGKFNTTQLWLSYSDQSNTLVIISDASRNQNRKAETISFLDTNTAIITTEWQAPLGTGSASPISQGTYFLYTHVTAEATLWKYDSGQENISGLWSPRKGWTFSDDEPRVNKWSLNGQTLRIAILPLEYLTDRKKLNETAIYSGLYIDYLNMLAESLNFTYVIVEPSDGLYGSDFDGDGQWNGVMGMVQRKEADIGLAPFTQTVDRRKAVDYLEYMTYSGLSMLMKKTKNHMSYDFLAVFKPFKSEVWALFVCSAFFSALFLWAALQLEYTITSSKRKQSLMLLRDCIRYIGGAGCAQGGVLPEESSSVSRIFVAAVWVTFIIIQATYMANLISYLTVPKESVPANTFKELVEQTSHVVGVIKSSSHEILLRTATSGIFKQVWNKIQTDPENLVLVQDGIARAKEGGFILVGEQFYSSFLTARDCDLVLGEEIVLNRYLGWITPKDWPHAKIFNSKIARIRESGILDLFSNRILSSGVVCNEKNEAIQLGLPSLRGLFVILAAGCFLGFLALVAETAVFHRTKFNPNKKNNCKREELFLFSMTQYLRNKQKSRGNQGVM